MKDVKSKSKKATATEVVFNLISTLILIGSDVDLKAMFTDKGFSPDFKQHIAFARGGLFKKSGEKFVKGIFVNVILKRKEYLDAYLLIEAKEQEKIKSKVPRRFGKVEIQKAIDDQGGKATEVQRMMLKVNDLKNIYAKLNRKGINTIFGDGDLSDKECRDIIASITTVETKLKKLL